VSCPEFIATNHYETRTSGVLEGAGSMSAAAKNRRRAKVKNRPGRRRALLVAACLGGAVVLAGLGAYRWWPWTASSDALSSLIVPEPPAIELAGADPAVGQLVSEARTAVCQSPRLAPAWGRLGMVLFVHSFPVEAGVCFAQAERLDKREARWPYFQGLTVAESEPERAIPKFQRAADLCADLPDAPRLRLAELLLGQGCFDQAQDQFQRVLQRDPANARAHLGLGRLAFLKGDLQQSQNHLVRSVADRRTQRASRILMAQIGERLGKTLTAEEYRLTAAMPDDREWPDPFLDEAFKLQTGKKMSLIRANFLLDQGRFLESIALSRQLVKDYHDSDAAWLILGKALVQKRDLPAAQEALQRVLRLAPDSVEAHFQLGFTSYLKKDYRAAAIWYRKATELKPDFTFAYHDLGHCLILLGDKAGAIEAFRAALRCQPDLAEVHRTLGELLFKDGQNAEAFVHARIALQLDPANATAKKLVQGLLRQIANPVGP
jgi:tetratricopeptide (TPR) repeat protein